MEHRILVDALAARYGGTAIATIELAGRLATSHDVRALTVITRSGSIVEEGLRSDSRVRCLPLPVPRRFELVQRTCWEAFRLPALIQRERCDALISMSGTVPRPPRTRLLCLVGNPVMYEESTPMNLLRRWAVRRTARDADHLVAPSRYLADMVSASAHHSCDVVPWGVDHNIFSPIDPPGHEILCVADFKAYKRHDLLLDAWSHLPSPRPSLRLLGNPDVEPHAYEQLIHRIAALPESESVTLESWVAHERLPAIYRRARVFVMPSEHESFCMPLAESMACGVPAVVRGIRSLRETGGEGARYIDGDDPAEWARALQLLIEDNEEHSRARSAAIAAAARFSWDSFAAALVAML